MIKSLRKRHRQIWIAWAILLPAGIILAWLVIPDQLPVKLLHDQTSSLLPIIVGQKKLKNYTLTIRSSEPGNQWQLQWSNEKELTVPSAVIYYITDSTRQIINNELIGRIEARGEYIFRLRPEITGNGRMEFILYDFIHEKIIDKIIIQQ